MVTIRHERAGDGAAREKLLDRVFGEARFLKTCERLRKDRLPAEGLAFAAYHGRKLVGTVRMWNVLAGSAGPALLLGPLAVAPEMRGRGIGAELMRHAIAEASLHGHGAILLVGDEPYYRRFGFSLARGEGPDAAGPRRPSPLPRPRARRGCVEGRPWHGRCSAGRHPAGRCGGSPSSGPRLSRVDFAGGWASAIAGQSAL